MHTSSRCFWIVFAASGLLWVILGAATGHAPLPAQAAVYFEKAQRYHIVHTLAGMVVCLAPLPWKAWTLTLWLAGILLFSGSLYAMALMQWPLRYIVPIGGIAFLSGWGWLLLAGLKTKSPNKHI